MKRFIIFLVMILMFLIVPAAEAWQEINLNPAYDKTFYKGIVVKNDLYDSFNASRSATTGTAYSAAYLYAGSYWVSAGPEYYTYRYLQTYDFSTLPAGTLITNASLRIKTRTDANKCNGLFVYNSTATPDLSATSDYSAISKHAGVFSTSSGINTYPLIKGVSNNKLFPAEKWVNLTLSQAYITYLNDILSNTTKYRKFMYLIANDSRDWAVPTNNMLCFLYGTSSTIKPVLYLNITKLNGTFPIYYYANTTNITSNTLKFGSTIFFNITPYILNPDNSNKYVLNYSSYKDGVGYYYGSIGLTAWGNNTYLKRLFKANYTHGGWFYYRYNFTSAGGKSIQIKHNQTNLIYNADYMYFTGNWTNLTRGSLPTKHYNFTSYLRTNGYPDKCFLQYKIYPAANTANYSISCRNGTNITHKNQTGIILLNFTYSNFVALRLWANLTDSTINASKWVNVSGYNVIFDNCTLLKSKTLNVIFYDEDNSQTKLLTTLEIAFNTTDPFGFSLSYSGIFTKRNNYSFCFNLNNTPYNTDLYLKFRSEQQAPDIIYNRFYYFNKTLNATQTNLTLYEFNNTNGLSNLKLTARYNSNYSYMRGIIAILQRFYTSENTWRSIQMDQADTFGQLVFSIREQNYDYRILYYNKYNNRFNNILYQTQKIKFLCASNLCTILHLINPYTPITPNRDPGIRASFSNQTKLLNVTWLDISGATTSVTLLAKIYYADRYIVVCNKTTYAPSGNFSCDLSLYPGKNAYYQIYSGGSPQKWHYSGFLDLTGQNFLPYKFKGGSSEAAFYGFFMMMATIGASALTGGVGFILGAVISIIVLYFGHFITFASITFLILSLIGSIVILVKVRR